jgi:hypothetical protein
MTIVTEERVRELSIVWVWRMGGSRCLAWMDESLLVAPTLVGGEFLGR